MSCLSFDWLDVERARALTREQLIEMYNDAVSCIEAIEQALLVGY